MTELFEIRVGDLIVIAPTVACALALVAWGTRRLRPHRHEAARAAPPGRSMATDLAYMLLSPVGELLSRLLGTAVIVASALLAGMRVGPELLDGFGPVAEQPRWLIVVEMLVLGDLMFYWTHRMAHRVPLLWRLHAIHHSTRHMRWSSAFRIHPAEAYGQVLHMLPLFLLGFPVDALLPIMPIVMLYAPFIHSDLDVRLGWLGYFVNTPSYHRFHHDREAGEHAGNYAGWFPIYDRLFGTYRAPEGRPAELGIDDPEMPASCVGQLLYPFRSLPSAEPSARPLEIAARQRFEPRLRYLTPSPERAQ